MGLRYMSQLQSSLSSAQQRRKFSTPFQALSFVQKYHLSRSCTVLNDDSTGGVSDMFLKVMRKVPQPVVVVTTAQQNSKTGVWLKRGVTCSSFTSVSSQPPIISFAMNKPSRMHDLLNLTNRFAVHVLARNQVGYALHFSKRVDEKKDQFENIPHEQDSQGTPILRDTCSVLQCNTYTVNEIGDHYIWNGQVINCYTNGTVQQMACPLLHYSRGFRSVGDEAFVEAFETQTLPFEDWTHEAHSRMAWYYLKELGREQAIPAIKNGIKKYNEQNKEKISRGYHETVTMFYINMISAGMEKSSDAEGTFEEFAELNPHLFDKNLLFQYYSEELINTEDACSMFVIPDKKPLPR